MIAQVREYSCSRHSVRDVSVRKKKLFADGSYQRPEFTKALTKLLSGVVIDPYRPGLKYPACSEQEFDILTAQYYLADVLDGLRTATVFVFTLGLTEAWISKLDGSVFPACPGTVAGSFDTERYIFHNFSAREVCDDLDEFIRVVRGVNPRIRFILTVSPVPLVATATNQHVLIATMYSKSVLRVAAEEAVNRLQDVTYFPAYEIVTGPQAPFDFFEDDRREPSARAIRTVMRAFLARCETIFTIDDGTVVGMSDRIPSDAKRPDAPAKLNQQLSTIMADALCEEAAADM